MSEITQISMVGNFYQPLIAAGMGANRIMLVMVPDGTPMSAKVTIGANTIPFALAGINALTAQQAVVGLIQVSLRDNATPADVKGSLANLAAVGSCTRSIKLNAGQTATLTVTAGTQTGTFTVTAPTPQAGKICLVTVSVTLTNEADPGCAGGTN